MVSWAFGTTAPVASWPYARMFEPSALEGGPSGLAEWPRPFVFRAAHLDGCTVRPGATFSFDLHLFDMRSPAIAYLVLAFSQLARDGLGPSRGRAGVAEVWQVGEGGEPLAKIYDGESFLLPEGPPPMQLSLEPAAEPVDRALVRFTTPGGGGAGDGLGEGRDRVGKRDVGFRMSDFGWCVNAGGAPWALASNRILFQHGFHQEDGRAEGCHAKADEHRGEIRPPETGRAVEDTQCASHGQPESTGRSRSVAFVQEQR